MRTYRFPFSPHRRGHGAVILVLLLGVALVLYLAFGNMGGGKSYTQQLSTTRQQGIQMARELETRQLSILIAQYRAENNRLPQTAADLDNDAAFRDPWGNPLTFTFETPRNGPVKIFYRSAGPDGELNTEDDVVKEDSLPF
jgi:cell division protein FtsB